MGFTIRELVTTWGFDVDDKPLKVVEGKVGKLKGALAAIASAAVPAALFAIVKSTASAGAEAARSAQKVGIGVERYQELAYAASRSSIEVDTFKMQLAQLNQRVVQAVEKGGDLAGTFQRIGIPLKDSSGAIRKTDAILMDLADHFQGMPAGPKRGAQAMELFGRSGVEMLPFLLKGRKGINELTVKARELGLVLSEQTIKQGKEFNSGIKDITAVVQGLKNAIGADLLPMAIEIVHGIEAWTMANREWIKSGILSALHFLENNYKTILFVASSLVALGMAGMFSSAALSVIQLVSALQKAVVSMSILDALTGNWAGLAAAAAIGGIAYTALGGLGGVGGGQASGPTKAATLNVIGGAPKGYAGPAQVTLAPVIQVSSPGGMDAHSVGSAAARAAIPQMDTMLRNAALQFAGSH